MDLSDSDSSDPLRPSASERESQKVVPFICRVKPTLWWLIVLGIFEAAFMLCAPFFVLADNTRSSRNIHHAPSHDLGTLVFTACISWPIALLIGWGMTCLAFDLKRGEIRADAVGLTWRTAFSNWKSARWEEITDFYQEHTGYKDSGTKSRVVETSAGKLELRSSYYGIEAIAELVVQKAAHTGNHSWEVKGMRPREEWSRTFTTWTGEQMWTAPVMTGALIFSVVSIPLLSLFSSAKTHPAPRVSMGFWWDVFPMIVFSMILAPFPFLMLWTAIVTWQERKFAWEHREESLVLNANGLVFTSPQKAIEASWDQVQTVTYLPPEKRVTPVVVTTSQGDFTLWKSNGAGNWWQVAPIIRLYAADVLKDETEGIRQQMLLQSDIEGERGAWSGGEVGLGAKRWGFRSSGTRFLLQCASGLIPFGLLLTLLNASNAAPPELDGRPIISWPLYAASCLCCLIALMAVWLWYCRAAVLADEEGLEIRSPFHRPRRASWTSISSMGRDAWGEFVRVEGRKIYFTHFLSPVRLEELRAHIEKHISR